jgi:hypothetical protein
VQNVPLFNSRNQAHLMAGYRFGLYSRGWDIQTAYSITDHLGIAANYNHFGAQYKDWEINTDIDDGHFRGDLFEFGLGYFIPITDKFIFETYGGMGWGGVRNEFSNYLSDLESKVNYNRYFVQPAIGWRHPKVSLALSTRLGMVHYTGYTQNDPNNQYGMYDLMGLEHNPCWLLEPAFTFRGGGKVVKFQAQVCLSFDLNNEEFNYDPFSFSFGVVATLGGKKKE